MTFDELRRLNTEIRARAIPPITYRGNRWYVLEPGKGMVDPRGLSEEEIDALMQRAFETEKRMFGLMTKPKPILVGPELLKWITSKNTDENSEEDNEQPKTQAEAKAR